MARLSATRTNFWAGLCADGVVALALLHAGLRRDDMHPASAVVALVFGLIAFSFIEYAFHRWLFHGPVRIMEQGHHQHHVEPVGYDSLPFFFAPTVTLLVAGALMLAMPATLALLLSGSLALGYTIYGTVHVVIHRTRFRRDLPRRWAAFHHIHHAHPDTNFGVTSPLWDIVLHTQYVPKRRPGVPRRV